MDDQAYRELYKRAYHRNKKVIENYISKYEESNGKIPSEKLIRAFCKLRSIEYPIGNEEDYVNRMMVIQ